MGRKMMSAACAASLFALVAPAAAQDASEPSAAPSSIPSAAPGNVPSTAPGDAARTMPAAPRATPIFTVMDPSGDRTKLEVDASMAMPTNGGADLWHGRMFGQLVTPEHFGGYVGISASVADNANDSQATLNNLEIGGVAQLALSPLADLGLRVGVALDTPDNDNALVGAVALGVLRPSDLLTAGEFGTLRLSVSPTYHDGPAFARIDLGVDVVLEDEHHKLGHLNAGFGYQVARVATTVELQTLHALDEDGTLSNVGVGVRYVGEVASPYVRVSTAFGDLADVLDVVGVTVGASFAL